MTRRSAAGRAALAAMAAVLALGPVLLGAGVAHATPAPPGQSDRPTLDRTERAAAVVRPAIVRIRMQVGAYVFDENGRPVNGGAPVGGPAFCTGFGVNPNGYVATAGHCVDTGATSQFAQEILVTAAQMTAAANPALVPDDVVAKALKSWTIRGTAPGTFMDRDVQVLTGSTEAGKEPTPHTAEVVDFKELEKGDVALLKIDVDALPTVQLAADADVRVGAELLAIGFPGSADNVVDASTEPSNKDGRISSRKSIEGVPFYEVSAALSPGMSGGPTVDLDGDVLGVNSWIPVGETQAINFIAPADGLAGMMARHGVRPEAGPDDIAFRAALDAYGAGRYTEAIAGLDTLLNRSPDHPQALQLRAAAARDRDRFGDVAAPSSGLPWGLSPLVFWSAVAGAAALLVVVALVLTRLRRSRRPDPISAAPGWPGASPSSWPPSAAPMPTGRFAQAAPTAVLAPVGPPCPRCGSALPQHAAFCDTCGLPRQPGPGFAHR